MSRKIPYDTALKMAKSNANASVYNHNNPYGYRINVNHPDIRPFYDRYKQKIGEKILSDAQRMEFERIIMKLIERNENNVQ